MQRQAMEGRLPGSGLAAKAAREKADPSQVAGAFTASLEPSGLPTLCGRNLPPTSVSRSTDFSRGGSEFWGYLCFKEHSIHHRQGPQPLAEENGQSRPTKSCLRLWALGCRPRPGCRWHGIGEGEHQARPRARQPRLGPECDGKAEWLICAHIPAKSIRREGHLLDAAQTAASQSSCQDPGREDLACLKDFVRYTWLGEALPCEF